MLKTRLQAEAEERSEEKRLSPQRVQRLNDVISNKERERTSREAEW